MPPAPVKSNPTTETYVPCKTVAMSPGLGCSTGHTDTMDHIQKKWPQLYGFLTTGTMPVQAPGRRVKSAAPSPLSKYMGPDGSLNFQGLVAAPDAELQAGVQVLTPQQKAVLRNRLAAFQPSFTQRLGAGAMGIDIEGQRGRFAKLLA